MDILKFSLGLRFDLLKDEITDADVDFILGQVSAVLSAEETSGLHLYGGKADYSDLDNNGIYTLIFMNAKMKPLRSIFLKLDGDAMIASLLDRRMPYIQNNTIRGLNNLDFLGVIGEDGSVSGGTAKDVVFHGPTTDRAKRLDETSIVIAPAGYGEIDAFEASLRLTRVFRKHFPGREIISFPIPESPDFMKAVEISAHAERHGMNVTSLYGGRINAYYLVARHETAVILSPGADAAETAVSSDDRVRTSAGFGELIRRAVHEGLKDVYLLIDGYEANDFGFGMARALGLRFVLNGEEVESYVPSAALDVSGIDPLLKKARFFICDLRSCVLNGDPFISVFEALNAVYIDPMQAFFRITSFVKSLDDAALLITGGRGDGPASALRASEGRHVVTACLYPDVDGERFNTPYSEIITGDFDEASDRLAEKIKNAI